MGIPEDVAEAIRGGGLGLLGGLIYEAISPDLVDGLSDVEFQVAKDALPKVLPLLERRQGSAIPRQFQLPSGFAAHYSRDVLPDLERIRNDAVLRERTRGDLAQVFNSEGEIKALYRPGGQTYSGILQTRTSGTGNLHVGESGPISGQGNENSHAGFEAEVLRKRNAVAAFHKRKRRRMKGGR